MKKILAILLLLLMANFAIGQQTWMLGGNKTARNMSLGVFQTDSGLVLPFVRPTTFPTFPSPHTYTGPVGMMYMDRYGDSSVYYHNGATWVKLLSSAAAGVTSVGSGHGLSGGPITTTGTLSLDTGLVYAEVLSTLDAGTGITITGRTISATSGGGTVSNIATGYGVLGGPITTTGTIYFDSAVVFPDFAITFDNGYGLTYGGRTFGLDTTIVYPGLISTLGAGTGINIAGRTIINTSPDQTVVLNAGYGITPSGTYPNFTITADTATLFTAMNSTLGAGYGILHTGRTFGLDTTTVYPGILGTLAGGYGVNISGRTIIGDSLELSSREWRQKAIDSVMNIFWNFYKDTTTTSFTTSMKPTIPLAHKLYTVQYNITAQSGALLIENPNITMANGQLLLFVIEDNGTPVALTYGADYRAGTDISSLPSTTTANKKLYLEFIRNASDSKLDLVGKANGY